MTDKQKPNVDVSELPDDVGVEVPVYSPSIVWLIPPLVALFIFFMVVLT